MNTGKLNRRITIITPGTMTPDGIGGFTQGTTTTRSTWCHAKQLSMSETLSYGLETSVDTYQFTFKYFAADDITRVRELTFLNRNFRISQIKNIDEANNEIQVIASERL